jgi:hypothetical protein
VRFLAPGDVRGRAALLLGALGKTGGALEGGASESGDERVERDDSVRERPVPAPARARGLVVVAAGGGVACFSNCGKGVARRRGVGDTGAGVGVRTREVEACTEAGSVGTSGGEFEFDLFELPGCSPSIHCRDPFGVTNGVAMSGSSVSCELP